MNYKAELEFAAKLAREAGVIMRRYFRAEDIGTEWKEDDTPLTVADTMINSMVIKRVKKSFPKHGVIGEEESYEVDRDFVWVVDPIDGTKPFSLGIPASTFLLALVDRSDGQPVVAVIYDPYLDHLYTATKGGGSHLNGVKLRTSKVTNFTRNYISLYGPPRKTNKINYQPGRVMDEFDLLGSSTFKLSSGAYVAAKIASGDFLIFIMGNGLPWDCAAVVLVVEEAGGVATDLEGNKRRYDEDALGCVIAANESLLSTALKLIKGNK